MLVLQFCPWGLWVQKTRREKSRALTVPGKRSGCCRATLLCSLSLSQLVPTSVETSLLPVKGTKHAEGIEPACCNPSIPLWFLSHQYIFLSFHLPLALVDALNFLALLSERTSLLFPAYSYTPAVTVISRPHLPLATHPKFFVILVETANIEIKHKLESCSSHTNPQTLERNFCPSLLSGTDHTFMFCMATKASS